MNIAPGGAGKETLKVDIFGLLFTFAGWPQMRLEKCPPMDFSVLRIKTREHPRKHGAAVLTHRPDQQMLL